MLAERKEGIMSNIKYHSWLIVIVFVLWAVPQASAMHWDIIYPLCFDDILTVEKLPGIRLSCEVIDCCPGCPGPPYEIDWRIRLAGDPIESVILQFEDLSPDQAKRLSIKGNGKWLGPNRLQVGTGETILSGFISDPKARPPVAIPQVAMDQDRVRKIMEAMGKEP